MTASSGIPTPVPPTSDPVVANKHKPERSGPLPLTGSPTRTATRHISSTGSDTEEQPRSSMVSVLAMSADPLVFVRSVALDLPGTTERLSHGSPTFFAGKKTFANYVDDHHGDGRLALWAACTPVDQAALLAENPDGFFFPPYVGHRGWIGIHLNRGLSEEEIAELLEDSYRLVATKTLLAELDARRETTGAAHDARRGAKGTERDAQPHSGPKKSETAVTPKRTKPSASPGAKERA